MMTRLRTGVQRRVEQHRHAVDVKERQHGEDPVVGAHALQRSDLRDVGGQVAVGEHDALGIARGARAVGQDGQVRGGVERHVRCGMRGPEQVVGVGVAVGGNAGTVEHDDLGIGQPDDGGRLERPGRAAASP